MESPDRAERHTNEAELRVRGQSRSVGRVQKGSSSNRFSSATPSVCGRVAGPPREAERRIGAGRRRPRCVVDGGHSGATCNSVMTLHEAEAGTPGLAHPPGRPAARLPTPAPPGAFSRDPFPGSPSSDDTGSTCSRREGKKQTRFRGFVRFSCGELQTSSRLVQERDDRNFEGTGPIRATGAAARSFHFLPPLGLWLTDLGSFRARLTEAKAIKALP